MTDFSARFRLPFILPGQAQKELYHNEAIALIDAAIHPAVEEGPLAEPPAFSSVGKSWIVGDSATGSWAGMDGRIATRTEAGWRFTAPLPGMPAWNIDAGYWLHWSGTAWSGGELPAASLRIGGQQVVGPRLADVPSPSGGTIIDAEAREAIVAVIATLKTHGLID